MSGSDSNDIIQALVRMRDRAKRELEKAQQELEQAEKALKALGSPQIGKKSRMNTEIRKVLEELNRPATIEEIREGLIAAGSTTLLMVPNEKYRIVEHRQYQQIKSAISICSSLSEKSKEVRFKTRDELIGLGSWPDSKWEKP